MRKIMPATDRIPVQWFSIPAPFSMGSYLSLILGFKLWAPHSRRAVLNEYDEKMKFSLRALKATVRTKHKSLSVTMNLDLVFPYQPT
jgi:hypothetical protein